VPSKGIICTNRQKSLSFLLWNERSLIKNDIWGWCNKNRRSNL
jgi:hypothetical protein